MGAFHILAASFFIALLPTSAISAECDRPAIAKHLGEFNETFDDFLTSYHYYNRDAWSLQSAIYFLETSTTTLIDMNQNSASCHDMDQQFEDVKFRFRDFQYWLDRYLEEYGADQQVLANYGDELDRIFGLLAIDFFPTFSL